MQLQSHVQLSQFACFQACSFLLGHPEELDYNKLYDACISLLVAGSKCDKTAKGNFSLLVK